LLLLLLNSEEFWNHVKDNPETLKLKTIDLGEVEIESNEFKDLIQINEESLAGRTFPSLRIATSTAGPIGKVTLVFTDIQGS